MVNLRSGYKLTMEINNTLTDEDACLIVKSNRKNAKEIIIHVDMSELFTIRRLFKQMIRIRIKQIINKI